MFIDIHAHAQRVEGAPRLGIKPWSSIRQLIERYDQLGIEKGVIQPLLGPEFYEPQSNQDILDMAAAYPKRVIPFFCLHPCAIANSRETDFRPLIEYYLSRGCKGFGECITNLPFLDPLVQNLFKQVNEYDLPLCFHVSDRPGHIYGLVDEPGLPQLETTLRSFTRIRFLGHSPTFWSEIGKLESPKDRTGYPKHVFQEEGAVPRLMRYYSNLYGDLSAGSGYKALARNPDYAVQFLAEFQDRLLFGTDICAPTTAVPLIPFLTNLRDTGRISETVFRKVTHENAIRLLGLEERPAKQGKREAIHVSQKKRQTRGKKSRPK